MGDARVVQTVTGLVSVDQLGATVTHEHLMIDMTCYWARPRELGRSQFATGPVQIQDLADLRRDPLGKRDNVVLDDLDLAIEEVMEFKKLGGGTIVDVTLPDIGRDPRALQAAARVTGLNIVMGCGHYVHLAHPPSLADESIEDIAGRLIKEIRHGVAETGIRPGIIGEIGTADPLHPHEEKVLRAAATAHVETGLAMTVHLDPAARAGHAVLGILEAMGANLGQVVLGHLDASIDESLSYHASLAERGCYLEYDSVGGEMYFPGLAGGAGFWLPSDRVRADAIARLFAMNFGDRVVISHDVCKKMDLQCYGGFGYGHILRSFTRDLRDAGLTASQIVQIVYDNPANLLGVPERVSQPAKVEA